LIERHAGPGEGVTHVVIRNHIAFPGKDFVEKFAPNGPKAARSFFWAATGAAPGRSGVCLPWRFRWVVALPNTAAASSRWRLSKTASHAAPSPRRRAHQTDAAASPCSRPSSLSPSSRSASWVRSRQSRKRASWPPRLHREDLADDLERLIGRVGQGRSGGQKQRLLRARHPSRPRHPPPRRSHQRALGPERLTPGGRLKTTALEAPTLRRTVAR